jgi:hypothetical protein
MDASVSVKPAETAELDDREVPVPTRPSRLLTQRNAEVPAFDAGQCSCSSDAAV